MKLNPNFWDCECEKNYVHSNLLMYCDMCGAYAEDQPDARQDEVEKLPFYKIDTDTVIERVYRALNGSFELYTWEQMINDCDLSEEEAKFAKTHLTYTVKYYE